MDKQLNNNPDKIDELDLNKDKKEQSENAQPLISNKEIQIKENNIPKNIFTGITQDMITVMPDKIPNLITDKEGTTNNNELNGDKNINNNENNNIDNNLLNNYQGHPCSNLDEQIEQLRKCQYIT